jgi:hypothetical protein
MSDAAEQLAQALRDLIDETMPVAIGSNGPGGDARDKRME